jgi:hypothetical protein
VLCAFLLLEVIVGIMLDLFTANYYVEETEVSLDTVESFRSSWIKRDPQKSFFVPVHEVPGILREVDRPLGPGNLGREAIVRFLMQLALPLRKDSDGNDAV